jgi:hypothetical protein
VYNKCVILLSKWVTLNAALCIYGDDVQAQLVASSCLLASLYRPHKKILTQFSLSCLLQLRQIDIRRLHVRLSVCVFNKKGRVRLILRPNFYLTAKKINLISNDNVANTKHISLKRFTKFCEIWDPHFEDKKTAILWDLALYNFIQRQVQIFRRNLPLISPRWEVSNISKEIFCLSIGNNRSLRKFRTRVPNFKASLSKTQQSTHI